MIKKESFIIFSFFCLQTSFALSLVTLSPSELVNSLYGSGFLVGEWESLDTYKKQFDYLESSKGTVNLLFSVSQNNDTIQHMQLQFLDPKYLEERFVIITVPLQNYNDTEITWKANNTYVNIEQYDNFKLINYHTIEMIGYEVRLEFNNPTNPDEYVNVIGSMASLNGQNETVNLKFHLRYIQQQYWSLVYYILFVLSITGISTFCSIRLIDKLVNHRMVYNQKFSSFSLGFLTYYHWYFFAINLFAQYPYINSPFYMIIPALSFLVSYYHTVKLFMLTWRFNHLDRVEDLQTRKKMLLMLLCKYYLAFAAFCMLIFIYDTTVWTFLLTGFFMVPQIFHNAIEGRGPKFIPEYIFGVLAINFVYPLYLRGCPENFKGLQPSYFFVAVWIPLIFVQILILYLQHLFGSRFFIPNCFLPQPYDYYKNKKVNTNIQDSEQYDTFECYVCLSDLTQDPMVDNADLETSLLEVSKPRVMITPCNHKFHESCLKSWMEVKLECPACRSVLPILQ